MERSCTTVIERLAVPTERKFCNFSLYPRNQSLYGDIYILSRCVGIRQRLQVLNNHNVADCVTIICRSLRWSRSVLGFMLRQFVNGHIYRRLLRPIDRHVTWLPRDQLSSTGVHFMLGFAVWYRRVWVESAHGRLHSFKTCPNLHHCHDSNFEKVNNLCYLLTCLKCSLPGTFPLVVHLRRYYLQTRMRKNSNSNGWLVEMEVSRISLNERKVPVGYIGA